MKGKEFEMSHMSEPQLILVETKELNRLKRSILYQKYFQIGEK
jgi:hypothetical protein